MNSRPVASGEEIERRWRLGGVASPFVLRLSSAAADTGVALQSVSHGLTAKSLTVFVRGDPATPAGPHEIE